MKFSMLVVNNNRSKAYIQNLIASGFIPDFVVIIQKSNVVLPEYTDADLLAQNFTGQKFLRYSIDACIGFDEKEHVLMTCKKNNIKHVVLNTLDVNHPSVIDEIKKISTEYIIYSGPGGAILKREILTQGRKFIHVHPGWLPGFRGSTTFYYSLLIDMTVSASVIIMSEGIDEGTILYQKKYAVMEKNVDFDYVLDPAIRAATLIEFLQNGEAKPRVQEGESNTFFIIHPVLKHLAILKHMKK